MVLGQEGEPHAQVTYPQNNSMFEEIVHFKSPAFSTVHHLRLWLSSLMIPDFASTVCMPRTRNPVSWWCDFFRSGFDEPSLSCPCFDQVTKYIPRYMFPEAVKLFELVPKQVLLGRFDRRRPRRLLGKLWAEISLIWPKWTRIPPTKKTGVKGQGKAIQRKRAPKMTS